MPRYETRTGLFGLISGIAQPESDLVLAAPPPAIFSPEARKGRLYIVAETGEGAARGRDACQLVIRTIRRAFYDDTSFSVTASLRKAIIAANRALYEQNFSAPAERRAIVGITCIVLKEHDMYIAQVAPAHAYVYAGGNLRALPAAAGWGGASGLLSQIKLRAIGASLTVEPEFFRSRMLPGDAALCCSSALASQLTREEVLALLRRPEADEIATTLIARCNTAGLLDAHGLALTMHAPLSPAARAAPLSRAGISERIAMGVQRSKERAAHLIGELVLTIRGPMARAKRRQEESRRARAQVEEQRLQTLPAEPAYSLDRAPMPQPLDLGPSIDDRLPPSALLGEAAYETLPERRVELRDTPARSPAVRRTRSGIGEGPLGTNLPQRGPLQRLSGALTGMLRSRRRNRPPPRAVAQARQPQGLSYRRQSTPFPWLLLLLLISLVAVLVLYGANISRENAIREADTSLLVAEQAMAALRDAPDDATAQERLEEAEVALAAVRASGLVTATVENQQRFEELNREYIRAQAAIQKLTYFDDLVEVAQHPLPGGLFDSVVVPPPPGAVTDTLAFGSIYLLDTNGGVLYSASKSGGPARPILRPEDVISSLSVGAVRGMDWRFDNIVAVAQSGDGGPFTFYFRNRENWSYSILAGSEEWGRVGERFRIANYEGNLYVWGAARSNVLRYLSGEYGNFPLPWIQNDGGQNLENVVDISVDGKIYLLQPDGAVLVFATTDSGERAFERAITPPVVTPPLVAATRFYVTGPPESGWIFLLDSYNARILQIDKISGEFIQQIRAQPDDTLTIDQMTDLYIDESGVRPVLYIVNGGQVLRASLPDQPRPFGARDEEAPTPTP
jgi:hypothetical protein